MRFYRCLLSLAFLICPVVYAQSGGPNLQTQMSANAATTGTGLAASGIGFHQIQWSLSGPAPSACTVSVDSSNDNSSWIVGGVIPAQTCTTGGISSKIGATAVYIRINLSTFTGSGNIFISYSGWASTGGGVTSSITSKGLDSPALSFTQGGSSGTTTNQYAVVATDGFGNTRSIYASDVNSNATMNGTNYNIITIAAWPSTGNFVLPVGSCNVYRTVSGGTPSSTGLIGTIASCSAGGSLNDTGLAGDSTTPPSDSSGTINTQQINVTGGCGGTVSMFAFPTCVTISVPGEANRDIAGLCMIDSNLANQQICLVMKSNGQTEIVFGNSNCTGDLEVNSLGNEVVFGPIAQSGTCDSDTTTSNGNIHLTPGTSGNMVFVDAPLLSGPLEAGGSLGAAITGTGACATFTAIVSKGFAADAICSGSTGASTIIITPAAGTPAASTSLNCWADDTTAGNLLKGIQLGASTSTCTVKFTSITTSDFITIHWEIL